MRQPRRARSHVWSFCCATILISLVLGLPRRGEATSYNFTTIDVPGATSNAPGGFPRGGASANGINNAGQIVGNFWDETGIARGFLYSGGVFTTIDVPGATSWGTVASGINNLGQIVGQAAGFPPPADVNRQVGFLYENGVLTTISVPQTIATNAYGINDAGQIVGYSAGGREGGFLYTAGTFDPMVFGGIALGINNAGEIVGVTGGAGFLYTAGTFTSIEVPGAGGTGAHGINNLGQIVGYYATGPAPEDRHGFVYEAGIFTTIDVPGATGGTVPWGINDAGQIVGYYADAVRAYAFVATPAPVPEPSTLLLLATGLSSLGGIAWRRSRKP